MRLAAALAVAAIGLAQAADPSKVIRYATQSAERGFDCARESDEITGTPSAFPIPAAMTPSG